MKLTEEQILSNSNIPTADILMDIEDTKKEITDFEDEKQVLMRNPQENRVRIYMIEGSLSKRIDFINQLYQIIEYRASKTKKAQHITKQKEE